MKKIYLLASLLIFSSVSMSQTIDISALYSQNSQPSQCDFTSCYSQSDIMNSATVSSFSSRESFLNLFTARQNIKVKMSQLLPSFNLRIDNVFNVFDYIPNLIGFIFPSNWFRLKESKLHAKAQEQSFISTIANQKNASQGLYLMLHQESINAKIVFNHIHFAKQLLSLMQARYEYGDIAYEDIEELNAFIGFMSTDYSMQKYLIKQIQLDMDYLVDNINIDLDAGPLNIKTPEYGEMIALNANELLAPVLEAAPELKSLAYLAHAAKYSKKTRVYNFLTPDSDIDSALGFGTAANLRIASSEIEQLEINRQMTQSELTKSLLLITNGITNSIALNASAHSIQRSLKYILTSLVDDFRVSSKIDINRFLSVLNDNLRAQFMINNSSHAYLQSMANISRLLLNGPDYSEIASLIPSSTTDIDCYLRKENRKIKKAVENGELTISDNLTFSKDELAFCF